MSDTVVGIDLGTTFSAVGYINDQGRPEAVPNSAGQTTTPSAVLIGEGEICVGDIALNQWVTNDEHVVRWIKRSIGDPDYRFQGLSAAEISAEILKTLKRDAELHLGVPVEEAVITCPAYFAAVEIENTKLAGELAGLKVREIVKEPTAAAVYYGVEHMRDGETILVCDLGGGTFDATVLSYDNGVFIPRASMGDRQLGGHDWSMELVALVAERLQDRFGDDPRNDLLAGQMLYEACERAKRDFARRTEVAIPCQFQGRIEQTVVTRDEFEARTEWRIQALAMWCERALAKAQPALTWRDVSCILLVGGSSRLRRMAGALEGASGKKPVQTGEADLMVALGAAILANGRVRPRKRAGGLMEAPGGLIEIDYKRIIARALGTRIIVFDNDKPRITNSLIIPHSTESPVSRSRNDYEVSVDNQEFFDVPVIEFEDDDEYVVTSNFRFRCPRGVRRGDKITVGFNYDISGIVTVEAMHQESRETLQVERLPYQEPNLEEVARARVGIRPRWVIFAVDTSYSMEGAKMTAAKQALIDNARTLIGTGGENCKVGIVSFDSKVRIVCRPTSHLSTIEESIATMAPSGTTAMDDGIQQAVEQAMGAPAGTTRDVVVLTDGQPDPERRANTLLAAEEARAKGVTLSTLGIGSHDIDRDFLDRMTPLSLVIDQVSEMGAGVGTLLTQSTKVRQGGLTDVVTGGLFEGGNP